MFYLMLNHRWHLSQPWGIIRWGALTKRWHVSPVWQINTPSGIVFWDNSRNDFHFLTKQHVCHSTDFPSRTHAPTEIRFHLASPTVTLVHNQSMAQSSCVVPTVIGQHHLINKLTVCFITAIHNYSQLVLPPLYLLGGLQDWIQRSLPLQSCPGTPREADFDCEGE